MAVKGHFRVLPWGQNNCIYRTGATWASKWSVLPAGPASQASGLPAGACQPGPEPASLARRACQADTWACQLALQACQLRLLGCSLGLPA